MINFLLNLQTKHTLIVIMLVMQLKKLFSVNLRELAVKSG